MTHPVAIDEVIAFWMKAGPRKWFDHNPAFDEVIRERFGPLHFSASRGERLDWDQTPEGALALLLLLDQFPRNLFRGSAHAFATDPMARAVAERALDAGFDQRMSPELRPFFHLPFTHSERPEDQNRSVALAQMHRDACGDESTLKWALIHSDIIARFERFPHRNTALGRTTTPEEQSFLDEGGFAG